MLDTRRIITWIKVNTICFHNTTRFTIIDVYILYFEVWHKKVEEKHVGIHLQVKSYIF